MTLANITLYNAIIPSYSADKKEEEIDADDPKNDNRIREILGFKKR